MNRKGELGGLLAIAPIAIIIFVIMGIYVFLAFAASAQYKGSAFAYLMPSLEGDLLLKKVNIDTGGEIKEMRVVDALAVRSESPDKDKITKSLDSELKKIVNQRDSCLIILVNSREMLGASASEDYFYHRFGWGGTTYSGAAAEAEKFGFATKFAYQAKQYMRHTALTNEKGERVTIDYYYGGCG